jgi:predicted acylesterase/phospholipase RssA
MLRRPLVLACAIFLLGCTNANRPLDLVTVPIESRRHNDTRAATSAVIVPLTSRQERAIVSSTRPSTLPVAPNSAFVGIAISGGGSRSANFSAACMFELQRIGLLQKTNYISSVSGGSLTAAYYCVSDKEWNPKEAQTRLTHAFASDVFGQTFLPWNMFALFFTDFDRSDLLAADFTKVLFSRNGRTLTYADLRSDRPHLLINATDLQSGRRFVFCNESFDEINSDLSKYPLGYAVAASAAVPVLMHQVTLRDYSTIFKQYRHLIDGGVADNLGVQTLIETYQAQMESAQKQSRPFPYQRAILIVIDAKTNFDVKLSDKGDIGFLESLKYGTGLTSTALINRAGGATMSEVVMRYSPDDATAKELREKIAALNSTGYVELSDQWHHTVQVVHLSLASINTLRNVPYHSFGDSVNNIATYFNIAPGEAYDLYQAASLLVREKFEDRLRNIAAELDSPMP